jgi:hypothetical protein
MKLQSGKETFAFSFDTRKQANATQKAANKTQKKAATTAKKQSKAKPQTKAT